MSKVKMGFNRLPMAEQIARARMVFKNMTGNVHYPSPNPSLVTFNDAIDMAEGAYIGSRGRDKDKVALMLVRKRELLVLVVQLAAYVQEASGGDGDKILSSGFDVAGRASLLSDTPGAVFNVRLRDGLYEGSMRARWNAAAHAVVYLIEVSTSSDFSGEIIRRYTTKTQKHITRLTPERKYWVRVRAIGRENEGNVSEPTALMVR